MGFALFSYGSMLNVVSTKDGWDTYKIVAKFDHDENRLITTLPDADNTYDLGNDSYRWRNVYAVNIYDVEHHTERLHAGDLVR